MDNSLDQIDQIIGAGLLRAEALAAEARAEIARRLPRSGSFDLLTLAREIIEGYLPLMAQTLSDAELAAWLAGADAVASRLPQDSLEMLQSLVSGPKLDSVAVQFPLLDRAVESLNERQIVTREVFDLMADEYRRNAFTVAYLESEDAIATVRDVLSEVTDEGASLTKFRNRLKDRLGGSKLGPAHLETVYRTNINAAFHQAHDELSSNAIVQSVFPYQEYLAIRDARVRPDHLALETLGLDGTAVYRRDDPMWQFFSPPWDFNCRCGVNLLTIEAAARKGVKEAREWLKTGRPPMNPTYRLEAIPFRPPTGFVRPGRQVA